MFSRLELFLLLFALVECDKHCKKPDILDAVLVSAKWAACNKWRRYEKRMH